MQTSSRAAVRSTPFSLIGTEEEQCLMTDDGSEHEADEREPANDLQSEGEELERTEIADELPEETSIDDVLVQLGELEETVDSKEELRELQDVQIAIERLPGSEFFRKRIDKYTTRDIAEGFVGSIILSLPLLVEDGVYDIADHFVTNTVGPIPIWLIGNVAFIVLMTWGLLYWSDFRDVHSPNPLLGFVPRRLVAVLVISLCTATMMMTLWGRVEGWSDPAVAFARVSVIWAAAAFGAALGDILPGQSTGTELGNVPEGVSSSLGEFRGDFPKDK